MGIFDKLFGRSEDKQEPVSRPTGFSDHSGKVVYTLLDPMMKQFMGQCIGAVKKAGIKAKGSDKFSIFVGEKLAELPLDRLWDRFQKSQDEAVFESVVTMAGRMMHSGPEPDLEQLYPYVIPEEYLEYIETRPDGIVRPLAHRLHVGLVFDLTSAVESLNAKELARLGITPEQAHTRAIENLKALAKAQAIKMAVFSGGETKKPFVLVAGHWASATAILLPKLKQLLEGPLGSNEILASIPHRDAMLLFAKGTRADRDEFRAMIKEKEGDGVKPLTFELFRLTDSGVEEFEED